MSEESHEGGCQCGNLRFRSAGQPIRAMACHCTTCKLRTGAAYGIGVYFKNEQIEFLGDSKPSIFEFRSDTSDRWIKTEFCSDCGSAVSWTLEMRPGLRAIAGGSYDNPDWYKLEAHIWTRSARTDMCFPDGMAVCETALPEN